MLKKKVKKDKLAASRKVFEGIDSDNKWLKIKHGENRVRILPSADEDGAIVAKGVQHFGFKVDGKNRAFPCMSSLGKPCPVCKLISHHDSDSDPDVQDLLKQIGPRKFFLFNVIDRKNGNGLVQIMSVGVTVAREINNLLNDTDYDDFTDPETGRDIKISKTGEGFGTDYSVRIAPKESAIDTEGWEESRYNLNKERYREIPTSKQYLKYIELCFGNVLDVEGVLGGKSKDEDDSEDEEDDADEDMEDDDEEDEDDDSEDEDEEDEKPVKKAKVKKVVKKLKRKKRPSSEDL